MRRWHNDRAIAEEIRNLKRTRATIIDERRWTTMPDCYSESGKIVVPWGRAAVEFSLIAALVRHDRWLNNLWHDTDGHVLVRLLGGRNIMDVADWSECEGRTHAEVIDLIDRGIAALAEEYRYAITRPLFPQLESAA